MKLEDFSGIKLLSWFLENPTKKIHFKDLCRKLELGPPTVKKYCEEYIGYGWIEEERKANLRIFSLNNEDFVVKAIKRAYFLKKLSGLGIGQIVDENAISLALYGSYSSGEYDEKSDIDLIIVGNEENVEHEKLEEMKKKLKMDVQLTIFSLEKWESNKDNDAFMNSVLRNNVLLKGAPL